MPFQKKKQLVKKDRQAQYAPSLDTIRIIQYLKRHDKPGAVNTYWSVGQALGIPWRQVSMAFQRGVRDKGLGQIVDQGKKRWDEKKKQWKPVNSLHLTIAGKNIQWNQQLLDRAMIKNRQMKRTKGFDMGEDIETRPDIGNSRVGIL